MKIVTLAPIDLATSAIGFGCAGLGGRAGRRASLRAIHIAFEGGVTYFDVAPSYGYGQAESILGEFLKTHRNQVVVTTKIGIEPPRRGGLLSAVAPIARRIASQLGLRRRTAIRRVAVGRAEPTTRNRFAIADVTKSLERSLRNLNTETIDILHLHSCDIANAQADDMLHFLQQAVDSGKIRFCGLATGVDTCNAVVRSTGTYKIAQFASHPADWGIARFEFRSATAVVTHSPFGRGIGLLDECSKRLRRDATATARWSSLAGQNLVDREGAARLLLSHALHSNPAGVVLCGMYDPRHVAVNLETAQNPFSADLTDAILDQCGLQAKLPKRCEQKA